MEIKTLEVKNISHYARGSEETLVTMQQYISMLRKPLRLAMMVGVAWTINIHTPTLEMEERALFKKQMNGASKLLVKKVLSSWQMVKKKLVPMTLIWSIIATMNCINGLIPKH